MHLCSNVSLLPPPPYFPSDLHGHLAALAGTTGVFPLGRLVACLPVYLSVCLPYYRFSVVLFKQRSCITAVKMTHCYASLPYTEPNHAGIMAPQCVTQDSMLACQMQNHPAGSPFFSAFSSTALPLPLSV